ncbi:MAG: response regulator [Anaerolineae bacterium]|jgi:pilus assembly protein CpaE
MSKKILVVDDDIETLRLVGLVLERAGHEIIVAVSGEQALEKALTRDPDIVILDIAMPGMDGYEVIRRLRSIRETADLPILVFTAKTEVQDKVAGFEAGADDYVTKPIHPEELRSRVEALLARSSRAHALEGVSPCHIVGFLGSKGGIGTTTLAVNAAVALTQGRLRDRRVVLAELRSGMATAALQLGFPHSGGIRPVLEQPADQIQPGLTEAQLDQLSTGLLVLTGETEPIGFAECITPAHAEAIIEHLSAVGDYLLLDLGVGLDEVNRWILRHCRHTVVTLESSQLSLALAEKLLDHMGQSLNIPGHRVSLVLINRSHSTATLTRESIEKRLNDKLMCLIPPAPELAFEAARQGLPMVMVHLDSFVVRQYRTFADQLIDAL